MIVRPCSSIAFNVDILLRVLRKRTPRNLCRPRSVYIWFTRWAWSTPPAADDERPWSRQSQKWQLHQHEARAILSDTFLCDCVVQIFDLVKRQLHNGADARALAGDDLPRLLASCRMWEWVRIGRVINQAEQVNTHATSDAARKITVGPGIGHEEPRCNSCGGCLTPICQSSLF